MRARGVSVGLGVFLLTLCGVQPVIGPSAGPFASRTLTRTPRDRSSSSAWTRPNLDCSVAEALAGNAIGGLFGSPGGSGPALLRMLVGAPGLPVP